MTGVPVVLSVAGSDSSGGAGVQADVKTLAALDVHGTTAVTAVTAQGADGITSWAAVDPELVREQIRTALDGFLPAAVKVGMLGTAEVVRAVVEALRKYEGPIVCDPVMISSSGRRLLDEDAVDALASGLLPLVALLTPNTEEAAVLTGRPVRTVEEAEAAGAALRERGPAAVLVKGGHLAESPGVDVLVDAGGTRRLEGEWIDSPHTHGTGCVTSAAIAAFLARGRSVDEAVVRAKRYVTEAIRAGGPLGNATGPVAPPRREPA